MGVAGELHSDAEEILINEGSNQEDIWGANLYPYKSADEMAYFLILALLILPKYLAVYCNI